eukprot:912370-Lingulodinium_polyedra.AAC.1
MTHAPGQGVVDGLQVVPCCLPQHGDWPSPAPPRPLGSSPTALCLHLEEELGQLPGPKLPVAQARCLPSHPAVEPQ